MVSFSRIFSTLSVLSLGLQPPSAFAANHSRFMNTGADAPKPKACWVFHHMVKSAGTTMRHILKKWAAREDISIGFFANKEWLQGEHFARAYLAQDLAVMSGGYTEGLRAYGGGRWFTVFRHPVSRLVSAYFYCKYKNRKDPLCAQEVLDLDKADLVAFAEHWSNYGLRQYVISQLSADMIASSTAARECKAAFGRDLCPGWVLAKQHIDGLRSNKTLAGMTDEAMYKFLQPTRQILSTNYAAVGILEDFDMSLRLFDRALEMPGLAWPRMYKKLGSVNIDKHKEQEKKNVLREAWVNSEIKEFLSLDLLLYEHAVAVHASQVAEYGLEA